MTERFDGSQMPFFLAFVMFLCAAAVGADEFDRLVDTVSRVEEAESREPENDAELARAVSDEAIRHRREQVIRFAPTDPNFSPKRADPKYQNPIIACRLALNPHDREALDYVLFSHAYRGQDDTFSRSSLAALWCRFGDGWPEELRESVRRDATSYEGYLGGGTENHIAMRRTSGFIFGERFADETFHYDLTGSQQAEECLRYMRDYGRALYATSQVEYLSPAYLGVNLAAWLHVAEFARDDRARLCAQAILDLLFADLAVNYQQGVVVPPFERQKGRLLSRYQMSYARSQAQFIGWLFFGGGNTPTDGNVFADQKHRPYHPHGLCLHQYAVSEWSPTAVIRNIGAKRVATPYMLLQSRGNWPCIEGASINQYGKRNRVSTHIYETEPRYRMRSVYVGRDYAIGGGCFRENMADPLIRTALPFGVTWKSDDDRNLLLAAHPFWFTQRPWEESEDLLGDEDWMGISPFCQMVHWENAVVLLYDLPETDPYRGEFGKGSAKFPSQRPEAVYQSAFVYVPDTIDERTETAAGFFLREGDVYIAVRPLVSGAHWQQSRHPGYLRLAMPGPLVGCAIEVGDRSEFGPFEEFVLKVSKTELDTSQLKSAKQATYRSSRGRLLSVRHTAEGWLPEASVDGVRLDFDRWPTCESPYMSLRDRVLKVNDGRHGFTIDWRGDLPVYERHEL